MYKNISKLVLVFCVVIVGCFYYAIVFAYTNPAADAGPDQNINLQNGPNFTTTLHGGGHDPNGGYLTYSWYCDGGYLSNPKIAEPVFTMPTTTSQSTSYNCTLTVRSNFGLSNSDNVIINVYDNSANNYIVQTNPATNNFGGQATLHGSIFSSNNNYNYGTTYVWFEWGTNTSYGKQSNHKLMTVKGYFDQNIADLSTNTIYHFRAASQFSNGQKYYGKDITFYSNAASTNIILAANTYASPTNVSTGLTNNFLTDSFFLPLLVAALGLWIFMFRRKNDKAEKRLQLKIEHIKATEDKEKL